MEIQFTVSIPPTDNQRLGHGRGRMWRTKRYKEFIDEVKLLAPKTKPLKYVDVVIAPKVGYQIDVHNLTKPTMDALQAAGVLQDDRYVISANATRRSTCEKGKMMITIKECERV